MTDEPRILRDVGERAIIQEILAPRYAATTPFGDDCATVGLEPGPGWNLVATTDPCPPPMAAVLGFGDPYYMGWLLATLNLSDLAAAAAEPLGLLTSLILPDDTTIKAFTRLLDGIDACCERVGTQVLGGNLKEGARIDVSATALGRCRADEQLRRVGARQGDRVLVIGDLGSFWGGVLGHRAGLIDSDPEHPLLRNVLTPEPKVAVMRALGAQGVLSAAMDNSDGLYPSLAQLCDANHVGVLIRGDELEFDADVADVADRLGLHPLRLALGWGDWQIVAGCAETDVAAVRSTAAAHGAHVFDLGPLDDGPGVRVAVDGREGPLLALDSQRFTVGSWFSSGLDGYVDVLTQAPLIDDEGEVGVRGAS